MNPFEVVRIGRTKVEVTRLGLGTAPIGGWPSKISEEDAVATVEAAWQAGIRYFDTAPLYGHGLSERRLGKALATKERSSFSLSTKVGRLLVPGDPAGSQFEGVPSLVPEFDFSADGIRRSLEESRQRLAMDRVDIALIHDPDDHHGQAVNDAYPVLARWRESGEIGAIGVGMNYSEPLTRFVEELDIDCVLCAGRYTLLEQGALDDLLPAVAARGASVIAGGVLNSGVLADPGPNATYNYVPAPDAVRERALQLRETCASFDVPLRAAAMQFPLAHPNVATVVIGARSPAEVRDCVAMLTMDIPAELWSTLKARELLRAEAPVPSS